MPLKAVILPLVRDACPVALPHNKGSSAQNFQESDLDVTLPPAPASEQVMQNGITLACHMQIGYHLTTT